ncbi:MAG TPA: nicotinate-nucleotide adenylyltransferase [Clostridia bacterium]|nr:nicotinate-nucleotide adenylyltransferase [Clostridia bacterium]
MQKIGIFGGAFNPPHKGHVRLARDFADRLSLTQVMVVPSFISPHKRATSLAGAQDRLAMCSLAFEGDERFVVSSMEIDRQGKSYTYDTLKVIKEQNPCADLYLIIGSDMFLSFDTWHRYKDILNLCTLCTAARETDHSLADNPYKAIVSDLPVLELNSTQLRAMLNNGEDVKIYVGEKVAAYIEDRGLYRD